MPEPLSYFTSVAAMATKAADSVRPPLIGRAMHPLCEMLHAARSTIVEECRPLRKRQARGGPAMIVKTILKNKSNNDVATTTAGETVGEAAKQLHSRRIGALVVVDADQKIVGILSERDIVRGMALHGSQAETLKVRDLMTSAVLVCGPDDPLEKLMGIMTNNRVRHLPVVEGAKLVGIITIGDVVKSRLEDATMQVDSLREYVMAAR
jgi:CBS domain-containing protein